MMTRGRRIASILVLSALLGAGWAPAASGALGPGGEGKPPGADAPDLLRAYWLWERGYLLHIFGEYGQAVQHFRKSIEIHPTAEAHTFLGWSLSHLGQIDEAIAECKKAIAVDPDYGNPYNDIGVYLIEKGQPEEAIPWLEKAIRSKRYCCYQFPHFNLGRVLLQKGQVGEAKRSFERALSHDPNYLPAKKALEFLKEQELETL